MRFLNKDGKYKKKGGDFTKKIFLVLILIALLMSFTGCRKEQTSITPSSPISQKQTKIVHIDSDPQGATVFIDDKFVVMTPSDVELTLGQHFI